ncbi:polyadenylate-binding protein-interacting protein 9-like isoform X2 [Phoenix dactylifera]|uniref:Polyadenylate-binding protein-interacting protein 9-like isoform X2 n=1 Tax=Phoenix dactylifera TaxID=42345 RepID=A0A8B9AP71_PHODC|nr:polyadenylate-binding protein-interacting protein 9-like isoform X2 [Phoenix dactylifera]
MAAVAENAIGSDIHRSSAAAAAETEYQRDVRKLVDLLSKLNPSAKEFFPSSYSTAAACVGRRPDGRLSADAPIFVAASDYNNNNDQVGNGSNKDSSSDGSVSNQPNRRRRNGYNQGRRRMNDRARRSVREDSIRRTVYVSDIDQLVTEETLAEIFATCGQVVDCRVCGGPHSVLRFAFIEFADEDGARAALNLCGTVLGYYPLRVLPSKTAILPVNPKFLPRSEDEKEMVVRTVYCTNIDKKVTQIDLKVFFEQCCGKVSRLRLLGDNVHSTRIAFVEFVQATGFGRERAPGAGARWGVGGWVWIDRVGPAPVPHLSFLPIWCESLHAMPTLGTEAILLNAVAIGLCWSLLLGHRLLLMNL